MKKLSNTTSLLKKTGFLQLLPDLTNSNRRKGNNGKIGIIGGSMEYTGAPFYSAISVLYGGADLSHVICGEKASPVIKGYSPELIVHPYLFDESFEEVSGGKKDYVRAKMIKLLGSFHALVIGPGLGRADTFFGVYRSELIKLQNKIMVFDADMLWHLLFHDKIDPEYNLFDFINQVQKNNQIILTPNQIEIARLLAVLKNETDPLKQIGDVKQMQDKAEQLFQKGEQDLYLEVETDILFEEGNGYYQLSSFVNRYQNVSIILKGKVDIILDSGKKIRIIGNEGSLKRCGGQGDVLCGLIGLYSFYAYKSNAETWKAIAFASILTRMIARHSFGKYAHCLTAYLMINEMPLVLPKIFQDQESSL